MSFLDLQTAVDELTRPEPLEACQHPPYNFHPDSQRPRAPTRMSRCYEHQQAVMMSLPRGLGCHLAAREPRDGGLKPHQVQAEAHLPRSHPHRRTLPDGDDTSHTPGARCRTSSFADDRIDKRRQSAFDVHKRPKLQLCLRRVRTQGLQTRSLPRRPSEAGRHWSPPIRQDRTSACSRSMASIPDLTHAHLVGSAERGAGDDASCTDHRLLARVVAVSRGSRLSRQSREVPRSEVTTRDVASKAVTEGR